MVARWGQLDLGVDRGLGFGDEAGDVAAADVDPDDRAVLDVFALDLAGPFLLGDLGEVLERDRASLGIDDPDRADLVGIVAPRLGEADPQRVPLVFLEHGADGRASQRGDRVEHVGGLDAVAGQLIAADLDPQHRQAARGRVLDVVRSVDLRQHPLDLQRQPAQHLEVRPVDEHGHVALDAGDQLVDPHLDRLAEAELHARNVLGQELVDLLDQGVAGQARAPLVLGFEHGPDVGLVHAHHVVGDLGAAGLAVDQPHLGDRLRAGSRSGSRRPRPLRARPTGFARPRSRGLPR